ncbi:ATPase, T2SS/T4P/T4SS family [Planctomycetota bacterium]
MASINQELSAFWQKFQILLRSGVPIHNSLDAIWKEARIPQLEKAVETMSAGIRKGSNLNEILSEFPELFPQTVITIIKAGEIKGQLEDACEQVAQGYKDGTFKAESAGDSVEIDAEDKDINEEMQRFWIKFHALIGSGVDLIRAFDTIAGETANDQLKDIIKAIKKTISAGESMSAAMGKYPAYFPPSVQDMVRAGEAGGVIDIIAQRISEGIESGVFVMGYTNEHMLAAAEGRDEPVGMEDHPVIKIVNLILLEGIQKRASDIHIDHTSKGLRIRLRIDGVLREIESPDPKLTAGIISRIKIMAHLDIAERRAPQDGRISLTVGGKDYDLRISTSPAVTGEGLVIRILSTSELTLDMEKLGLSDDHMETLKHLIHQAYGMVIVTGPTGCGKTTTIYSMLHEINSEEIKIITTEDPVEYQIDGLVQMQVAPRQGRTFERCIRASLRQDPDVMMIAEIRNLETAHLLCQVALTGHLVFTTLHTSNSVSSIRRLLDIGLEPFLVNSTLNGVVSQRLVRRVCQKCKKPHAPEKWMMELDPTLKKGTFYKGKGCDACNQTGFKGRMALYEMLVIDNEMRTLIAKDADYETLQMHAVKSGLITLREDGFAKAAQGLTTIEEILRVLPVG